jgi:hypothetical protein
MGGGGEEAEDVRHSITQIWFNFPSRKFALERPDNEGCFRSRRPECKYTFMDNGLVALLSTQRSCTYVSYLLYTRL